MRGAAAGPEAGAVSLPLMLYSDRCNLYNPDSRAPTALHSRSYSLATEPALSDQTLKDEGVATPCDAFGNPGTPGGTRTPDPQVRRPIPTQEVTPTYGSCPASACRGVHKDAPVTSPRLYTSPPHPSHFWVPAVCRGGPPPGYPPHRPRRRCRHSALGMGSPIEYENAGSRQQESSYPTPENPGHTTLRVNPGKGDAALLPDVAQRAQLL